MLRRFYPSWRNDAPIAEHPKPLPFFLLDSHPMRGFFAKFLHQNHRGKIFFLATHLSEILLDFPFDRQPWQSQPGTNGASNPAMDLDRITRSLRTILRVCPTCKCRWHKEVHNEEQTWSSASFFTQLLIEPDRIPPRQPLGFLLSKPRLHRKMPTGQMKRCFIIDRTVAVFHALKPLLLKDSSITIGTANVQLHGFFLWQKQL